MATQNRIELKNDKGRIFMWFLTIRYKIYSLNYFKKFDFVITKLKENKKLNETHCIHSIIDEIIVVSINLQLN